VFGGLAGRLQCLVNVAAANTNNVIVTWQSGLVNEKMQKNLLDFTGKSLSVESTVIEVLMRASVQNTRIPVVTIFPVILQTTITAQTLYPSQSVQTTAKRGG